MGEPHVPRGTGVPPEGLVQTQRDIGSDCRAGARRRAVMTTAGSESMVPVGPDLASGPSAYPGREASDRNKRPAGERQPYGGVAFYRAGPRVRAVWVRAVWVQAEEQTAETSRPAGKRQPYSGVGFNGPCRAGPCVRAVSVSGPGTRNGAWTRGPAHIDQGKRRHRIHSRDTMRAATRSLSPNQAAGGDPSAFNPWRNENNDGVGQHHHGQRSQIAINPAW